MGVSTTGLLHQEMKREFVLERLHKLGVRETQTGKSIHKADYDELKYELVLASFREIDTGNAESKWF